ncbi:epoxide hydrolase [Paractinoplanes deccanensis]|uniref:Epoxide hydrolase n=1 Tax=Paractinoplanes deccanensis TaxID=113561 RepID=A0ABQ3YL27_9ACTN|nr:alpha/beta hydrolase [Actinoplanes deccanensis]GID80693.1 epoxide hydrolase [Actinoplanes deccanensis]
METPRRLSVLIGAAVLTVVILVGGTLNASASTPQPANAATQSDAPACVAPERPLSRDFDAATRKNAAFNSNFRHCFTTINGVQMHYVIGGHGPDPLVLLHGWPQSWYAYHDIMPELLPGRTVIAIDHAGLGDSTGTPPAMTTNVLAEYVHLLLNRLGLQRDVQVVAHDIGVGVAYALAAQYRRQVAGLFNLDFALVGKSLKFADLVPLAFHFSFNQQTFSEELLTGRVGFFLTNFYPLVSTLPQPIAARDIAEYTRVYSRPQVLHNGMEFYRDWPKVDQDNAVLMRTPLTIPVRLLSMGLIPAWTALSQQSMKDAAPAATGTAVDGAGHWLIEERPALVISEINKFYPVG